MFILGKPCIKGYEYDMNEGFLHGDVSGFPFIVWGSGGWTLIRLEWLVGSASRRRRVVVVGSAAGR